MLAIFLKTYLPIKEKTMIIKDLLSVDNDSYVSMNLIERRKKEPPPFEHSLNFIQETLYLINNYSKFYMKIVIKYAIKFSSK